MRGGYRVGAGRPGWHAKTAGKLQVDVRRLHRDGHLSGCYELQWTWANRAQITLHTNPDEVTLVYGGKDRGGNWREVNQPVAITRTPCHYGGARPWFVCPQCLRRVAILYLWNVPQCRTCARLVYSSQSDDAIGRSWRRTRKIEARLKGDAKRWNYHRPKGMRQATYERLVAAYLREEHLREEALRAFGGRLLGRLGA